MNNYRTEKLKKKIYKGNKKLDNLVKFLFVFGSLLLTFQIFIYRSTIIDLKIPLLIWLTPGIILTPIFYHKLNDVEGKKVHWIMHYFVHSCITGAFVLFSFMAINYFYAEKEIIIKEFKVQERGMLSSQESSYVTINYEGMKKDLIFSDSRIDEVMNSKTAILKVKKGRFGFEILEEYDLK